MNRKLGITTLIALLGFLASTAVGAEIPTPDSNFQAADPFTLSLIRIAKPSGEHKTLITAKEVIERAFNHDELIAISNERGLATCMSRVMTRAQFSSRYIFESGNCSADYLAPTTKLNSVAIMKTASNRALYRLASDQIRRNPVLTALVDGKVDFDFSFSDLVQKITSSDELEGRPVYVLQVSELASNVGLNLNDEHAKKKIIEQWPVKKKEIEEQQKAFPEATYTQRLAHKFGLAHGPFTKYKLKIEKTAPGFVMSFNIRFQELNDLAYLDLTSFVMRSDLKNVKYGYRVPYKSHAVGGDYNTLYADPVWYYSYTTSRGYGKLLYNTFNKAVGVEIAMSI